MRNTRRATGFLSSSAMCQFSAVSPTAQLQQPGPRSAGYEVQKANLRHRRPGPVSSAASSRTTRSVTPGDGVGGSLLLANSLEGDDRGPVLPLGLELGRPLPLVHR
jgi:hypothetical protein